MADSAKYVTVAGIVQFDPQEREVQGKDVRDITIRGVGEMTKDGQRKYRITLWPDLAHAPVKRGDAVFVDGKGSRNENKETGAVYYNVSANAIVVNGVPYAAERDEVENAVAPSAVADDDIPF